jgi:hypothetical protein
LEDGSLLVWNRLTSVHISLISPNTCEGMYPL